MKSVVILSLFLCGCQTRHGSETAAVNRAIERNIAAIERAGKSVVVIERHSDSIAHATHDAKIIVSKNDGKANVILEWIRQNMK